MKRTLLESMKAGNGVEIAKGEIVTVAFDVPREKADPSKGFVHSSFSVTTADGRRIVSRKPHKVGFKTPGLRALEKYSDDGIAKSVFGARVEPDGIDADGSPSWLLFLGLI